MCSHNWRSAQSRAMNLAHVLKVVNLPIRTATPEANGANWWHSTAFSEFSVPFLNGAQRSVNRKVQGSNPCPGASFGSELDARGGPTTVIPAPGLEAPWRLSSRHLLSVDVDGVDALVEKCERSSDAGHLGVG